MSALRAEYERGSQLFLSQIDWLGGQGYTHFRRAKGTSIHPQQRAPLISAIQAMAIASTDVSPHPDLLSPVFSILTE
jgi:hypothetical protein